MSRRDGSIKLADGSVLKLRAVVLSIKEAGFSPFGGVNLVVKPIAGVSAEYVPEELRRNVRNRPAIPPTPPQEGWEMIEVMEYRSAVDEQEYDTSKGRFRVRVEVEPLMIARNMMFRAGEDLDEPVYWVSWVYKISWSPIKVQPS